LSEEEEEEEYENDDNENEDEDEEEEEVGSKSSAWVSRELSKSNCSGSKFLKEASVSSFSL
jgi:hypothetical protein